MDTKILNRVAALISKAEDRAVTPEEAAAYRAKADQLMRQYRIEEEHLIASDPIAVSPVIEELVLCEQRSDFSQDYINIMHAAAQHAGVRAQYMWTRRDGHTVLLATLVGYEGDVRMAAWIYSAARLVFVEKIEPAVDKMLTDEENIYRLRSAGITRRNVAWQLWELDTHAAHAKVGAVYKAECAKRGETPALDGRGISAALYRSQYAQGFSTALYWKLREARDAADSVGGPLVLHGRAERVDEAFYEAFPHLKPKAQPTEAELALQESLPAKKSKAPRPRKWTQADEARFQRNHSPVAEAGRAAGQAAVRQVQIDRASNAQRVDPGAQTRSSQAIEG